MRDEKDFYKRCQEIAGDTSKARWTEDHMAFFFQRFRPDGHGLEPLFGELPGGDEVLDRLREIFQATASKYQRGDATDAYFVVREAASIDHAVLQEYATTQLLNWRRMAEQHGETALVGLLTPLPEVRLKIGEPPLIDPNDFDSLDVYIYDIQTDWWHGQLTPLCPEAKWMREAFYYINSDYYLARYAEWPWYRDSSTIADPYEPYFKMWLHGAELRCQAPEDVTLYVQR